MKVSKSLLAAAIASLLTACGSGGSVEFQSQKGDPEILVVDEYKIETAKGPSLVQEENRPLGVNGPALIQGEKRPLGVNGPGLVNVHPYAVNGPSTFRGELVYAEAESKGEPLVQWQEAYGESQKGESLVNSVPEYHFQKGDSVVHNIQDFVYENGNPAFNEVEELAICQREGLRDQDSCESVLVSINSGMTEAHYIAMENPEAFKRDALGRVRTAEGYFRRALKREGEYAEVIQYIVDACMRSYVAEDGSPIELDAVSARNARYLCAGQAMAAYYYVNGVPSDHKDVGNPGLCADRGLCGDIFLKYQWE